jgi:hypothetical protein
VVSLDKVEQMKMTRYSIVIILIMAVTFCAHCEQNETKEMTHLTELRENMKTMMAGQLFYHFISIDMIKQVFCLNIDELS